MAAAAPLEEAIDRLYQLPLGEFVAARNELARGFRGPDARTVRTLEKPSLVAWALNQVYWSARPVFDRLVEATRHLRDAQAQALLGRRSDLPAAGTAHHQAVDAAVRQATAVLAAAGHVASGETLRSLTAAFESLPWKDRAGRLVRPPSAIGFEAFAGMPIAARLETAATGGVPARERKAEGPSVGQPGPGAPRREPAANRSGGTPPRRAAAERTAHEAVVRRQQAREAVEAARRGAAAAGERLRSAEAQLADARQAERAAREQLEGARHRVEDAEGTFRAAEREVNAAEFALRRAEASARRAGAQG